MSGVDYCWFSDVNCRPKKSFCTAVHPFTLAPRHKHKQRGSHMVTVNKCFASTMLLGCCCKCSLSSTATAGRIVETINQPVWLFWSPVELSGKSMCPKRAIITCLWGSRGMSRPSDLDMRYLLYVEPIFLPRAGASDPAAVPTHGVIDALETSPNRRTRPRLLVCILIYTSRHSTGRNQKQNPSRCCSSAFRKIWIQYVDCARSRGVRKVKTGCCSQTSRKRSCSSCEVPARTLQECAVFHVRNSMVGNPMPKCPELCWTLTRRACFATCVGLKILQVSSSISLARQFLFVRPPCPGWALEPQQAACSQ